eukprot:3251445-Pleurochrysis_carterae.AAC.3
MLEMCGSSCLHITRQSGCTPFDESSGEGSRGLPHKQRVSCKSPLFHPAQTWPVSRAGSRRRAGRAAVRTRHACRAAGRAGGAESGTNSNLISISVSYIDVLLDPD